MVVQEVKLTYCFYENPAAKQEIKFWESLVEDKIQTKSFIGDVWAYSLVKDYEKEFVCCIPMEDNTCYESLDIVVEDAFDLHRKSDNEILTYNKTLIFGKVSIYHLKNITKEMIAWEG